MNLVSIIAFFLEYHPSHPFSNLQSIILPQKYHRSHPFLLSTRSMTHSTSTNTLLASIGMQPCDDIFHAQSPPSKAFMLLRQCIILRTVCIRRLVRIGRQGLRLLRCFCLCGEHACLSAAYRSLLRPCLYVCLGCLLLAARPVRICVRERHASKQMRVDVDRRLISVGVRVWQDRLRGICNVGSR